MCQRANMSDVLHKYQLNSLVSEELELIDPTPNIFTLFVQFNERFFWGNLDPVEVKWSNRMTSCAGICTFHARNKQCVITLSAPLLKLRPRKDLVETLLHEMIHAFLFLTNNDRDRDGHGPNFRKHMYRINSEAGTNITIYHNFHNEVKLYQQHWWKCNGPCQYRPPYFGMVRRSMNRPPGRSDFWWADHQKNCNGQFIKIKEPQNYKSNLKRSNTSKLKVRNDKSKIDITNWFIKKTTPTITSKLYQDEQTTHSSKIFNQSNDKPNTSKTSNTSKNNGTNSSSAVSNFSPRNSLNNNLRKGHSFIHSTIRTIHDSTEKVRKDKSDIASRSSKFSCSGVLGGNGSGRSNLLTKFEHLNNDSNHLSHESTSIALLSSSSGSSTSSASSYSSASSASLLRSSSLSWLSASASSISSSSSCSSVSLSSSSSSSPRLSATSLPPSLPWSLSSSAATSSSLSSVSSSSASASALMSSSSLKLTTDLSANNSYPSQQRTDVISCPVCDTLINFENLYNHVDTCLLNSSLIDEINNNVDNNNVSGLILHRSPRRLSIEQKNDETDVNNKRRKLDESYVNCPVCNDMFSPADIDQHLDECLERNNKDNKFEMIIDESESENENENDKAREINTPSTSYTTDNNININSSNNFDLNFIESSNAQSFTNTNTDRNATNEVNKQKCLVCNATLIAQISLNEHLEECIGKLFDDVIVINDDENDDNIASVRSDYMQNKYPCPVCMQMISENLMNQHLDKCLKDE